MKKILYILSVIICVIFSFEYSSAGVSELNAKSRTDNFELKKTIFGILVYLNDTQVIDRAGTRSSVFDASDAGDGCDGKVEFNVPFFRNELQLPAMPPIKVRNLEGEWNSTVHFLPKKTGAKGQSIIAIPDSNLFVPSFVVYPLFLFRESGVDADKRLISSMMKNSWNIDKKYKRGDAYNFWLPMIDGPKYVGPYNIPLDKAIVPLAKIYVNPKLKLFWKRFTAKLNVPSPDWVISCLDSENNPSGVSALFNIPNDSDDSSTALSIQKLKSGFFKAYPDDPFFCDASNFAIDYPVADVIARYRDVNRDPKFEDGRDSWKGFNTGAFLTWLKDETAPTFASAETGVMPLAKNNVDAVVNSNVLLMAGLLNKKDIAGYSEACNVVSTAIAKKVWPQCGLYYPQLMILPYTASRAYRDGCNEALRPAMRTLLKDILDIQLNYSASSEKKAGAFPGGEDRTDYLSTALGLTTLLNIGRDIAREEKLEAEYDIAIKSAVKYLISTRAKYKVKNDETIAFSENRDELYGYQWDSGLFFSASFWDLAQWRSEPFCNAMILEALVKYMLGYDCGGVDIMSGRKLNVINYPCDMSDGQIENFRLEVK